MDDVPPDRLAANPKSPYHDAAAVTPRRRTAERPVAAYRLGRRPGSILAKAARPATTIALKNQQTAAEYA
jgi:hypothetical protein